MKKLLIITMLLGVGYSQCNESNWEEYYFSEGHNMEGCNLEGADLSGVSLQWATLDYANLDGANLEGADLTGVYFRQANLLGTNLEWANLNNTNLCHLTASPNGDECEDPDGFTDDNNDGYDDVSYEAGYIAGHGDGVVFGMESVDITIDNQAVCEDCYADGEASVDTNSDGLVDEFPVITVVGEDVQILTQTDDDEYVDAGATCSDAQDGSISHGVEVSGQVVNLRIIGIYTIDYNCADSDGNQAITESRTVIVQADYSDEDEDGYDDASYEAGAQSVDTNSDGLVDEFPLITISGGSVVTITQNNDTNYVDDGAICYSGEMNYSQNVEVSGDVVNMSNIGTYIITYNCSDNEGNQAMSKSRTVIILADYSDEDEDGYDDASYEAGATSGDLNLDGIDNVLDVVILVSNILSP